MNGKRKREDDRIAFAIHFATGVKSRMPAPPAVRNIEYLVKMTILNTNCIAGAPNNDALMVFWKFENSFIKCLRGRDRTRGKIDVWSRSLAPALNLIACLVRLRPFDTFRFLGGYSMTVRSLLCAFIILGALSHNT